jgi:hypothetical protein
MDAWSLYNERVSDCLTGEAARELAAIARDRSKWTGTVRGSQLEEARTAAEASAEQTHAVSSLPLGLHAAQRIAGLVKLDPDLGHRVQMMVKRGKTVVEILEKFLPQSN